jgi:hypothetical protein
VARFQELLAQLMVAEWTVLHFDRPLLISSDRGYAVADTHIGRGYAVRVDRQTALLIASGPTMRSVLRRVNGSWIAPLRHEDASKEDGSSLNDGIVAHALDAVFGPTERSVDVGSTDIGRVEPTARASMAPPGGIDAWCHIYDYFRVGFVRAHVKKRSQKWDSFRSRLEHRAPDLEGSRPLRSAEARTHGWWGKR